MNGKTLSANSGADYGPSMFQDFQIPDPDSNPREILAWNKEPIFDRIDHGVSMMTVHRKLSAFLEDQKGEFSPLVYQTFRRFVARENARNSGRTPAVVKAKSEPENDRKKPDLSSKKTAPRLPLRKPKIGPAGVDFSGTGTAEELFGPAPPKKS